ncbi:hypothetical protein H7F15_16995 [Pontibacter sp. Tf4]|uniref:hypothetical protein n=1 Tax=Pontibacter sp. Tf4 TaxID=2761620 RepID=UPI00162556DC|nr:hypothetical protein [Pontibacter sp. Tf4]MBB6612742.1 hypothetical protein [Pontibacter sp. Tf4]
MLKYFFLWFPMVVLAVLNGTARDLWYKEYVGELAARQISTITLLLLFAVYIWFVVRKYPPATSGQALTIGMLWLVLTLIFEFGVGFMSGRTWAQMLEDYNLLAGRLWILIPFWVAVAPYLFYKMIKT